MSEIEAPTSESTRMPGSYEETPEPVPPAPRESVESSRAALTDVEPVHMSDSGLNVKLVEAIEKQAELEDSIASTAQELQAAKNRIRVLEQEQAEHKRSIDSGLLVPKTIVEEQKTNFSIELSREREQRAIAETSRKEIEKELEDLTRSLFEEANKMVAVERIENASIKERNEHLSTQLKDCEVLLASHQAQLEELKTVLQKMSAKEDLQDSRPGSPNPNNRHAHRYSRDSLKGLRTPLTGTFPSPIVSQLDAESRKSLEDPIPGFSEPVKEELATIANPEEFAGMLMPRYRTDTLAFSDFVALLHHQHTRPQIHRTASASSLGDEKSRQATGGPRDSSVTPARVASPSMERSITAGTLWTRYSESLTDPKRDKEVLLKDTKFLKRALIEDIEPTLRLDQGPELGYLSRRSILNAVVDGNLIVEPMPAHLSRYQPDRSPCALCGESRYTEQLKRRFRLKTSDKIDTQPYPLCDWCKDRVRSVCTYVAFLKQVKDGLWKSTNESEDMKVWEESVKLRESMFWCRIGHVIDE